MMMAQILDTKYLGVSSLVRLGIKVAGSSGFMAIDIFAHHGKGAARLPGGSINNVERMREVMEANIYIQGHDHKKSATPVMKLEATGTGGNLKVRYKKQLLVRSGSFLRGYVDGETSYVADALMTPCDLGVIRIILTAKRDRTKGQECVDIDIHADT